MGVAYQFIILLYIHDKLKHLFSSNCSHLLYYFCHWCWPCYHRDAVLLAWYLSSENWCTSSCLKSLKRDAIVSGRSWFLMYVILSWWSIEVYIADEYKTVYILFYISTHCVNRCYSSRRAYSIRFFGMHTWPSLLGFCVVISTGKCSFL